MQTYHTLSSIASKSGYSTMSIAIAVSRTSIQPDGLLASGPAIYGEDKVSAILDAMRDHRASRSPLARKSCTPKK